MGQVLVGTHLLPEIAGEVPEAVIAVPAKILIGEEKQRERVISAREGARVVRPALKIIHPAAPRHQDPARRNQKDLQRDLHGHEGQRLHPQEHRERQLLALQDEQRQEGQRPRGSQAALLVRAVAHPQGVLRGDQGNEAGAGAGQPPEPAAQDEVQRARVPVPLLPH